MTENQFKCLVIVLTVPFFLYKHAHKQNICPIVGLLAGLSTPLLDSKKNVCLSNLK